jgi:hypothetical protein
MFKIIFEGKAEKMITNCIIMCPICETRYKVSVDPANKILTSRPKSFCDLCEEDLPPLAGLLFHHDAKVRFHRKENPPECRVIYTPGV